MSTSRVWDSVKPGLSSWILEAVKTLGFDKMTPVQAAVIPLFCGNKDVVVEAVTGSGKTLSFVIPVIERLLKINEPITAGSMYAMVVAPTRELAEQIHNVFEQLLELGPKDGKNKHILRSQLIIGGKVSAHADLSLFLKNKPHILVATPGRLLELLSASAVKCASLETLVLDEADRLLDLGFEVTISKILAFLPKQKRAGLFSATISDAVGKLARVGLRNPVKISVSSGNSQQSTPTTLDLSYAVLESEQKIPLLLHLISSKSYRRAIVYLPTCTGVNYFYSLLRFLQKFSTTAFPELYSLHGKLPPGPRHNTLQKFSETPNQCVLLTTDVAARGLDIPQVELVIQHDPPGDPNMFTHRAGRAGRAGALGEAIVFLNAGREEDYVSFLKVRKVKLREFEISDTDINAMKLFEREAEIREWLLEDRARYDLAMKSFLSYVRFYTKHTATSIFRTSNLDLVKVARSYHLLRMPKMPELKNKEDLPDGAWLGDPVDMDTYAYENPQQEKSRLEALQKAKLEGPRRLNRSKDATALNGAWAGKLERKENAAERREKRKKKQIARKEAELAEHGVGDGSEAELEQDWKKAIQDKRRKKNEESISAFDDL